MSYFLTLAVALWMYMNFWFIYSVVKKRNDIADVAWGLGFVFLAWIAFYFSQQSSISNVLINVLVTVWGLRLAFHIYSRHRKGGEDYRYLKYRENWGRWFYIRSYCQIYILQGALLFVVSTPVLLVNRAPFESLDVLLVVGVLVWAIGFYFESVGDHQLARFIKDPNNKGKLMTEGLWRYSRHPNYFGEVLQWWAIWIMTVSAPFGVWGVIGPLTITFLILKVSGIPMLEEKLAEHPDFADYKRRVSAFIPLPPKKE